MTEQAQSIFSALRPTIERYWEHITTLCNESDRQPGSHSHEFFISRLIEKAANKQIDPRKRAGYAVLAVDLLDEGFCLRLNEEAIAIKKPAIVDCRSNCGKPLMIWKKLWIGKKSSEAKPFYARFLGLTPMFPISLLLPLANARILPTHKIFEIDFLAA